MVHLPAVLNKAMEGKRIRKQVVAEAVKSEERQHTGIHISIGKACEATLSAQQVPMDDTDGANLALELEEHLTNGNCDSFAAKFAEAATHHDLENHGQGPNVMHGKGEISEHCEKKVAKTRDIVRLSFAHPLATISQEEEGGLRTTTVILEKSKKVKFSQKIMTIPVAWVIGHRDGKIERSSYYDMDAKHLVDKYGFKYGAESPGFLARWIGKQHEEQHSPDRRWRSSADPYE